MQTVIRFAGNCPTCGRHLHIPIELYGKRVRCHGCNAEFRASGRSEALHPETIPDRNLSESARPLAWSSLDSRIDSLLAAADRQLGYP